VGPLLTSGLPRDDAEAAADMRRCHEVLAAQLAAAHSEFFENLVEDPEHLNDPSVTIENRFNRHKAGDWVRERRQEDNVYVFHGTRIYLRRAVCIYACYLPDAPADKESVLPTIPKDDVYRLFGQSPPETLTAYELSCILRDRGRNDASKEVTEDRYYSCMSMACDELNALSISALCNLAEINASGAVKAAALCREYGYGDNFGALPMLSAAKLLIEAGAAFRDLALEIRDKSNNALADILDELGEQAIVRLAAPAEAEEFFEKVFRARGFELPPEYRQIRDFMDEIDRVMESEAPEYEVRSSDQPEAASETIAEVQPEQVAVRGAAKVTEQEVMARMHERGLQQLSYVILPMVEGGKTSSETKAVIKQEVHTRFTRKQAETIWDRLQDLIDVRDAEDGVLAESFGFDNEVYFYTQFFRGDYLVTIAESPREEFASQIYIEGPESKTPADEVFLFHRREAQQLGARAVIHSPKQPHGEGHIRRIMDCVDKMIADIATENK
jgi:hypothetical protein